MGTRGASSPQAQITLGERPQRAVFNQGRAIKGAGPLGHDSGDLSLTRSLPGSDRASQHLLTIRAHASVPILSPSCRASNYAHECTGCDLRVRAKGSTLHIA